MLKETAMGMLEIENLIPKDGSVEVPELLQLDVVHF